MKEIPLNHPIRKDWKLVIPDDYQKIPLPYFKEWVSALESGEYKQAIGYLRRCVNNEFSYCCLGVLSKIQGRLSPEGFDGSSKYYLYDNPISRILGPSGDFPKDVYVVKDNNEQLFLLSSLNDYGLPFSEIAKVIKEIWCEESLDKVE